MVRITKPLVTGYAVPEVRRALCQDRLTGCGVILRLSGVHSIVISDRNAKNRQRTITIVKVGTIAPDIARALLGGLRVAEVSMEVVETAFRPIGEGKRAGKSRVRGVDPHRGFDGWKGPEEGHGRTKSFTGTLAPRCPKSAMQRCKNQIHILRGGKKRPDAKPA